MVKSPNLIGQSLSIDSLKGMGICDENGFCIPSLPGLPRSKGLEILQHSVFDYGITSTSDSLGNSESELKSDNKISIKLKFPIAIKDNFQLAGGLGYSKEEFRFDDPETIENEFYRNIEDKPLRQLSANLYGIRPFKGNKYLGGRMSISLNGDFNSGFGSTTDYLRASVAVLYGIRSRFSKVEGFGLAYSFSFGRPAIYPLYAYNKQFNSKHGLEVLLPAHIKYRFSPNEKNIIYVSTQLDGSNYNINLESISNESLYLGKSDLLTMLTFEREIHDFFWVTASAGLRSNLNFDVDREREIIARSEPFIDNQINDALFVRFGIFLVPPKAWMEKLEK